MDKIKEDINSNIDYIYGIEDFILFNIYNTQSNLYIQNIPYYISNNIFIKITLKFIWNHKKYTKMVKEILRKNNIAKDITLN